VAPQAKAQNVSEGHRIYIPTDGSVPRGFFCSHSIGTICGYINNLNTHPMTMVMLHRGRLFICLVAILLFVSCSEKKNDDKTMIFKAISKHIIGHIEYTKIYNNIVDTLNCWKTNNLFGVSVACNYSCFQTDSLLCFNKHRNRMITCILERNCSEDNGDGIHFFYGVKIKNAWFFFLGPSIFIPREMYVSKNKIHEPLSFAKLHEIAIKEVFSGYLREKNKGQLEVNEAWFKQRLEGLGWGDFNDQDSEDWFLKGKRFKTEKEYYEFAYLQKVRNNWCWKDK
jgi:hypothetical protein